MTAVTTLSRQRLQQLAEEAKVLANWTTVRDYALQMYGEGKAASVEISTYGEFNDEGGTNYSIEAVVAYDKDGKELRFDHSLPFFASATWGKDETENDDEAENEEEDGEDEEEEGSHEEFRLFREIYDLADEDKKHGWILLEDLPVDVHEGSDETYDLTRPPSLTLPVA